MTEPRVPVRATWGPTLVFSLATATLSAAAALVIFSAFMFYDDEGYVLLSLRNFAEHGHLYREVYSQYGPFPYVFYYLLDLLGLPLTHTAGRLLTLGAWAGTAVFCAVLVRQATRSLVAQLAVLTSVFVYLWIMASEPTHPGGLIALITGGLAALGWRFIEAERLRAWAVLAGASVAALLLTKINVGVFAALSALAWLLLHHRHDAVRRMAPWLLMIGGVLLPLALMRTLLAVPWVQTFALAFACSAVASIGAATLAAGPRASWGKLFRGAGAAALVALVVLGVIFARGTTPADLLEGIVLGPLRQPANFSLRFRWPPGIDAIALGSTALCGIAWLLRRRQVAAIEVGIAVLRLVVAIALAVTIGRFDAISPNNLTFGYTLPCLWLFLWPLAGEKPGAGGARTWLGLLLLGQCLHVFPVPGSQIAWSSLLALPLAALGAWEAVTWLARRFPREAAHGWRREGIALRVAVVAFTLWAGGQLAKVGSRYRDGLDLRLPGAERVRLPENTTALFQLLTLNATAHGDMLFSLPGMFSLNLWSGLPPPTLRNVTHWFSLLNDSQQREIIRSLEAHPRACLIVHREHIEFLTKRGLQPVGPLMDYIGENFAPAFTLDAFEFCVRKGRKIAALSVGEVFTRQIGQPGTADAENSFLKFTVLLPPGKTVETVEILRVDEASPPPPLVLNRNSARAEIQPIDLSGAPTGVATAAAWPLALPGPAVVSLYFDRKGQRFTSVKTLIVVRDAAGEELALVRLPP